MRIKINFLITNLLLFSSLVAQTDYKNVQLSRPRGAKYPYAQTEPSIAINPLNPQEIIAGTIVNDYYYSLDGGRKWISKSLKSKYGVWGDPVMLFDKHGAAYYFHLSQYKKVFIDRIVCQRAKKPAKKFSEGSFPEPNGEKAQDKQAVAYSHQKDEIYMTWTQFDVYGSSSPSDSSVILFSKSKDQGLSWTKPKRISKWAGDCVDSDNTVEGAYPTVDKEGNIYVVWSSAKGLCWQQSTDGGETWLAEERILEQLGGGWDLKIPGINRCNGFPVLHADTSGGQHNGRLYINWSDQRAGEKNTDVWLMYSDNQGKTWTKPIKVNQDNSDKHQFFSWLAIDQSTGKLYVVYFDRRNYSDLQTDVYLSVSSDGGENFTDYRISEKPFVPDEREFFGDYNNISAAKGIVRPIWPRMDNEKISLWVALIDNL